MKFCKALQKVADASDPSYRPYWVGYKKLKKLIKAIGIQDVEDRKMSASSAIATRSSKKYVVEASAQMTFQSPEKQPLHRPPARLPTGEPSATIFTKRAPTILKEEIKAQLQQNPSEVAFFQLLHAELGKASEFFEKTEKQFALREEIVRVGMEVLKRPASRTVKDRWSVVSRAVFVLYKDLLLLETFAIMTYFAFSKILKKHDKVTGIATREPFMINLVNRAPFTNYPRILEMIKNCQLLYNDASQRLVQGIMMQEEEQLFLHMVNQMQQRTQQHYGAQVRAAAAAAPGMVMAPHATVNPSLDSKPAALTHAQLLERSGLARSRPAASTHNAASSSAQGAGGEPAGDNNSTDSDVHRPCKKRRFRGDSRSQKGGPDSSR
mmetsp:Transcript_14146/g.39112  ORF Transcript_14146/g.39112 Transcript_14146/m.39112 type:complete len:380 (+) Transcript_14146:117-1256(+)